MRYLHYNIKFAENFGRMASLEDVEENLAVSVRRLIVMYDELKMRNDELTQKLKSLESQLSETEEKLKDCRKELQDTRYAKATQVSEQEARKMYNRMLKLEREIEKCVSLLNE